MKKEQLIELHLATDNFSHYKKMREYQRRGVKLVQRHDLILGLVALGKDSLGATPNRPIPIFSDDAALGLLVDLKLRWRPIGQDKSQQCD
jgi:hypothetical protein